MVLMTVITTVVSYWYHHFQTSDSEFSVLPSRSFVLFTTDTTAFTENISIHKTFRLTNIRIDINFQLRDTQK